jgi:hypothetical protein
MPETNSLSASVGERAGVRCRFVFYAFSCGESIVSEIVVRNPKTFAM